MLNNDVNPKTLSRIELLKLAHTLRVTDADVMTRAELRAAIERARTPEARQQGQSASWLGKARRLLASVVERGLHLPEAATLIRGGLPVRPHSAGPPPVATVTLARIYAAQGHYVRAIGILDEVLVSDPDHELARGLREELQKLLDERRAQERQQQAASAARVTAEAEATPEPELEEAPPSEAQLAASELLGAVPDLEAPGAEEITLAGTAPERRSLDPGSLDPGSLDPGSLDPGSLDPGSLDPGELEPRELEPAAAEASAPPAAEPGEPASAVESDAETRRGSGAPAPLVATAEPEPSIAAAPAPELPGASEAALTDRAEQSPPPVTGEPQATDLAEQSPPPVTGEQGAAAISAEVAAVAAPAAAVATAPRAAGLVLIETSGPGAYLYWELASPALANGASNGGEPHWVCVVTHAPRGAKSERREYRFPVQRAAGAVRLEGLPRYAVVRAKLTRGEAPEAAALVVAGSVRVGSTAADCNDRALREAQPGFLPHPAADPGALAQRAGAHLASAAPLYY